MRKRIEPQSEVIRAIFVMQEGSGMSVKGQ